MWSKRLEDIRPGTVMVYAILLLILGYLRVVFHPLSSYDWTFLGEEYEMFPGIRWVLPILWAILAVTINFLVSEQFQVLKRYSYLGFLWGILMIVIGEFRFAVFSVMALLWFLSVLRLQNSQRQIPDFLDVGLILGIFTLFDWRFSYLLLVSWIIFLVFARLRWRAMFGSIWGAVTVHLLFSMGYLVFGDFDVYKNYLLSWPDQEVILPHPENYVWMAVLLIWWVLSLGNYVAALSRANIVKRQSLSALLLVQLALIGFAIAGLWPPKMYLAFIPLGTLVFIANDLQYCKKYWWRDVVFWSFIVLYGLSLFPEL